MIPDVLARCYEQVNALADLSLDIPEDCRIEGLFSRPFVVLHALSDLYAAHTALALAMDLGWEKRLRTGATLVELLEGFQPPSTIPADWILRFLTEKGLLTQRGTRFFLEGSPSLDLVELREVTEREAPGHLHNLDLLDAVRSHIKPYFTEGKSGDACLFDLAVFPLWLDYFRNENILYRSNNVFALTALRRVLQPGCRILELGGGAGSFAQLLSKLPAEELSKIADYRFTDVAPTFLRRAQRGLRDMAPGIPYSFGSFDLNRPFEEQGLADAVFDVIVGINVVHVAKDLLETLGNLKRHLAPGGKLILGECLKPDLSKPIYLEFFVQFMASFTDVKTDALLRPSHGFLTPEIWVRALEASGYRDVQNIPDVRHLMERFPDFNVGAFAATN
jgi:SAM-dependent methyltransferase